VTTEPARQSGVYVKTKLGYLAHCALCSWSFPTRHSILIGYETAEEAQGALDRHREERHVAPDVLDPPRCEECGEGELEGAAEPRDYGGLAFHHYLHPECKDQADEKWAQKILEYNREAGNL
jgi:hypothetical protein